MGFEDELSEELKKPLVLTKQELENREIPKGEIYTKIIEFTNQIRKAYGDLIKSVLIFGSAATGEMKKTSDADVWVILDDTATKGTEDLERIQAQLQLISAQTKDIHVQTTSLTEFWGWMKRGSPELFNYLRACLVIYDTGFVKPVQRMLKAGLLPPSEETISIKARSADAHLKKVELAMKSMIFDLRYAATDACQSVIMYYYKTTPDQKHMAEELEKLVKEKKLEKEYIEKFTELNELWKDIEHEVIKKVEPKHLDRAMALATDIIERMKKLLPKDLTEIDLPL
ncbi:MAG: nucleotidyltransferase domain-containing protein [Candidatus Aenigmarchaeota archaeon]|nr:nucleotidyltransferase domain-containing protein [Candidatus Aenigmarchaeota archaeon]